MGYFNYHAKAKGLIADGHCTGFEIVDNWNNISPALLLYSTIIVQCLSENTDGMNIGD